MSEYGGLTVLAFGFLFVAVAVSGLAYAVAMALTDDEGMRNTIALVAACVVFIAFLRGAKRRLIFSITLGPHGVSFGSAIPVPYDEIELVQASPLEGNPKNRDHWIEVRTAREKWCVFLDNEERECARLIFERSADVVYVDERGEDHVHTDMPHPMQAVRVVLDYRSRAARRSTKIAVGLGAVALLAIAVVIISAASSGIPNPIVTPLAIMFGALAWHEAKQAATHSWRARQARRAVDEAKSKGVI